jgi:hypothetical protein
MPRLGHIHLGIRVPVIKDGVPKMQDGKPVMRPEKTDYFVLDKLNSGYQKIVDLFGPQPKELRILIPVEDEELWATQYYKMYDMTRGLICRGDGENSSRMIDVKTGNLPNKDTGTVGMKDMICAGKNCPEYKAKKCGEVMNLRFILPEVPGLGIWQIDTGSINSILNINSCAKMIKAAFGRISMVPLSLTLEPIEVNNPETGKKQKVYVLNLRSTVTLAQLADVAREQSKTFLLEAPDWDAVSEQKAEEDIKELWPEDNPKVDKTTGEIKPEVITDNLDQQGAPVTLTPPAAATASQPPALGFDPDILLEDLKKINWPEKTTKSFLSTHYHVQMDGTIPEVVARLTNEMRDSFFKEIEDRKVMA